ncbi:MAG: hypothetical protein KA419_10855 [Acidobacteria bacterium]|nr:hypothetical protein [Acidobacteriota bacterium]
MRIRKRTFEETSPVADLLLRQAMGLGRYRHVRPRDPDKERILVNLALRIIAEREKDDFIPLGPRRRRVRID